MLIGSLAGLVCTYLNSKKKKLNENGVVDTLGSIFIFLIPSFGGAIYSAILFTTSAYGPLNDDQYVQVDTDRSRWAQGGMQMLGLAITSLVAAFCGSIIGLLMKIFTITLERDDYFVDDVYIEKDLNK